MKAFLILLFVSIFASASEVYMLDFKLSSLHKQKVFDLNKFKGKPVFLTFIESECKWCDKQLKAFNDLLKSKHSQDIEIVVVTIGDDIEKLKLKTKELDIVVRASKYLLESIGGVKMTPYTLVADAKGNFDTKIIGFHDVNKLESIIHKLKGER